MSDKYSEVLQAIQDGKLSLAKEQLLELKVQEPQNHQVLKLLSEIASQEGDYQQAGELIEAAIHLEGEKAEYYFSLGELLIKRNQMPRAIQSLQTSANLDEHYLAPRQKLMEYYRSIGQLEGMKKYLSELTKLNPEEPSHWILSGQVYGKEGQFGQAIECFEQVVELGHGNDQIHNRLAALYFKVKNINQSINHSLKTTELNPDFVTAHLNLINLYYQLNLSEKLLPHLRQALAIKPESYKMLLRLPSNDVLSESSITIFEELLKFKEGQCIHSLTNLAIIYTRLSEFDIAQNYFNQAQKLEPHNSHLVFQRTFTLPYIYKSHQDILDWQKRFTANLTWLKNKITEPNFIVPEPAPIPANFIVAYQGLNSKDLLMDTADMMSKLYRQVSTTPRFKNDKIRVGILSAFLNDHSVYDCYRNLIVSFSNSSEFELVLISFKETHTELQQVETLALANQNYSQQIESIQSLSLDILIYLEIGMHAATYRLALNRLASVQCVMAGHPITTGMESMDYFISGDSYATPNSQDYYREKLALLKGMVGVNYRAPERPLQTKSKQDLNLPSTGHLYTCPMTLIKIHPDFDHALQHILEQDQDGHIILFKTLNRQLHPPLIKRLSQLMNPEQLNRVHFLDWMPKEDFLLTLIYSDVVLDSFHFGGGNTCFLTLGLAIPMVTWPSEFLRGRACYGLYKQMDMLDCIANSQEHYVELAVKIATSPELRDQLSQTIATKNHVLFNDNQGIETFKDFCKGIL